MDWFPDGIERMQKELEILRRENQLLRNEIEKYKYENDYFRAILDNVPCEVAVTDRNDNVILYNSYVEQAEEVQRSKVLGKNAKDIPCYAKVLAKIYPVVRETGKPLINTPYVIETADGRWKASIANTYPFYYNGELAGIYGIGYVSSLVSQLMDFTLEMQKKLLTEFNPSAPGSRCYSSLEDVIGISPQIKECCNQARMIAKHPLPVMIIGETGTGKEIFAQGIHCASIFGKGVFVPVNCAAIPESLMESILFGTVKGSFTGATDSPGLFEQAENGTIFLDEINSLPYPFQAKLLRVIQDKRVRRIGDKKEIPIHCRIISASNVDPFRKENKDVFRADLFFRLAVTVIKLPPLRERKEDIIPLTNHFFLKCNAAFGTKILGLNDELKEVFQACFWEGNIRELENIIQSAMNFVKEGDEILCMEHIPPYFQEKLLIPSKSSSLANEDGSHSASSTLRTKEHGYVTHPEGNTLADIVHNFEKEVIVISLDKNNWHISKTAQDLGILRPNLHAKINKYKLKNIK